MGDKTVWKPGIIAETPANKGRQAGLNAANLVET
jgi:hypothetical protein